MNNKLICPFCNRNLHKGEDGIYSHLDYMTECKGRLFDGTKELWQELIRTRKALDVAVDALKRLEKELYFNNAKQTGHIADSVMSIPSIALDQITALEQKE